MRGNTETVRLLMKHKADANKTIFMAMINHNIKALECLLEAGVHVDTLIKNPNGKSKNRISLLCFAIFLKNTEMVKMLLKKGAILKSSIHGNILTFAIEQSANVDIIKALIKHGSKINSKSKREDPPLHVAVNRKETEIVKILLQNGAKVNIKDRVKCTPLQHAIPSVEIAKLLLHYGAKIDVQDAYQSTLVHDAINHFDEKDVQKYIRFLILSGAPMNVRDSFQTTPIEKVLCYRNIGTLKVIMYNQF